MITRAGYATLVLTRGGWSVTDQHVEALVTVMTAENSAARWNPLDTELAGPGTSYNSAGVRDYTTLNDGIAASVATLQLAPYQQIVALLADPATTAAQVVAAWAASPWGTWDSPEAAIADLDAVTRSSLADWIVPVAGSTPDQTIAAADTTPLPEGSMLTADPETNGFWIARPDGAVYAYGGAPYLGGLNNHPQWGRGGPGQPPCTGIFYDKATGGYALSADSPTFAQPELYRFPRSGIYA